MDSWFCSEKEKDTPLPTATPTPHFMILWPNVVGEGRGALSVAYLLKEKMGHQTQGSPATPRPGQLGTHLGIAGTAERQEELGDAAGGASCLSVVLQSLGHHSHEQEDLQSLQGLVGQEQQVYPAQAQASISTPSPPVFWDLGWT